MKKLLILPALALAACGQSMPAPTTSTINVTGKWTGTATVEVPAHQSPQAALLILSQASDGALTGTLTDSQTGRTESIAGTVGSGKMTGNLEGYTTALQGTFTNTTYLGTFVTTQDSDHSVSTSGTFSFNKSR